MNLAFQKYILDFKFNAGTSRGVLKQKETYFLKITGDNDETFGIGEAGPLKGLSVDDQPLEDKLVEIQQAITSESLPDNVSDIYALAKSLAGYDFPSIRFGLETAMIDLLNGGNRIIFQNDFSGSKKKIPINGLIWMGHMEDMLTQITEKVDQGFTCIKMKVGSIDFDKECDILQYIRRKYYQKDLMVRVDANGAFSTIEALEKLERLSQFNLHSIEQPIKAGQPEAMKELCLRSPIKIALDEELIGVNEKSQKEKLLEHIKPPYIILKPTLLGGIQSTLEWIEIAESLNIGWWMTSALESNVGLNAISQLAAELKVENYQGLGTGQLYHNNIPSPLVVKGGFISYTGNEWEFSNLEI